MKDKPGIYKIFSIKFPDRFYIGSSSNIFKRFRQHKKTLLKNKHHSIKLQNHYNKYGIDDLVFVIIETIEQIDVKLLLEREQYYIDKMLPYFNICANARSTKGRPSWNQGKKLSPQHIANISKSMSEAMRRAKHHKRSKESIEKQKSTIKEKGISEETRMKISISKKGNSNSKIPHPWNKEKNKKTKPKTVFKKGHVPWNKGLKF